MNDDIKPIIKDMTGRKIRVGDTVIFAMGLGHLRRCKVLDMKWSMFRGRSPLARLKVKKPENKKPSWMDINRRSPETQFYIAESKMAKLLEELSK